MPVSQIDGARGLQGVLRSEIESAVAYNDSELAEDRAESLRYYRGEPFGNEEDGRSQVVWRVVRQAVRQIVPSLMRVFFGSERVVEYMPRGPEDAQSAEQATDYANFVVLQDNPGFQVFYDVFSDSLYQKMGVVKLWRDESVDVSYHDFTGLDDAGVATVLQEPGTELVRVSSKVENEQTVGQFLMLGIDPPLLHDIQVKKVTTSPRIRICAVPGEEFLVDPYARTLDDARYVGHRMLKTVGELVALGYDRDLVEGKIHSAEGFLSSSQSIERNSNWAYGGNQTTNPDGRKVLYTESWMRVDLDGKNDDEGFPLGDGIAELRKFCTIGEDYEIVNGDGLGEPASEIPFACFTPFPDPHAFYGEDVADQTKDLQKTISSLIRAVFDSLAFSIYPRTAIVDGRVRMSDVLNTEVGAPIRMDAPGMAQPFTHEFTGRHAIPVIQMIADEADKRVGVHNLALEADALQSTTKAAVNAQVDAARQQLELIARLYAESGMKRFYTLLLKLIVAHQDKPRTIRLRNEWVTVDPSTWNASMDCAVNVGLGQGMPEDRVNALREAQAFNLQVMQSLGPNNPLVSLGQVAHTQAKLYEIAGWKDTSQFINPLPRDFQLPTPPPQPSDTQILAQVESRKTDVKALESAVEADLARDKLLADIHLRAAEINAKYPGTVVDVNAIAASIDADRLVRTDG